MERFFEESFLPGLSEFIAIPNISQLYDDEFFTNGLNQKAGNHIMNWCKKAGVKGLEVECIEIEGKPPVLFLEVEASKER